MKQAAHTTASYVVTTDAELLHSIRIGLRSVYKEVLKQPVPRTIEALLMRLEEDETFSIPSTVPASRSPADGHPDHGSRH
jgi:hypothetical protein